MKRLRSIITLALVCITLSVCAQVNVSFVDNIRTIQVQVNGKWGEPPVMLLGSGQYVESQDNVTAAEQDGQSRRQRDAFRQSAGRGSEISVVFHEEGRFRVERMERTHARLGNRYSERFMERHTALLRCEGFNRKNG